MLTIAYKTISTGDNPLLDPTINATQCMQGITGQQSSVLDIFDKISKTSFSTIHQALLATHATNFIRPAAY